MFFASCTPRANGLPGLIIDVYGDTAVLQAHSVGMYHARPEIAAALQVVFGPQLRAIFDKSAENPARPTPSPMPKTATCWARALARNTS